MLILLQYMSVERSRYFAKVWGSKLVDIGARGHVNTDSGCGEWPEGRLLLSELVDRACKFRED